ncbi:MAG: zinc-finger domain-containing protein [Burkholderiales bacterium]
MTTKTEPKELNQRFVDVTAADLPLHCPMPSMKLWNTHPRVFLPIEQTGEALCPYCGTRYKLQGGLPAGSH